MKTYTIISDRYSNEPAEVTFEKLVEMCKECFNDTDTDWDNEFTVSSDNIKDSSGEVVAVDTEEYNAE